MATKVTPKDLIDTLSAAYDLKSQREVAEFLGVTQGRVSQIKKSPNITKTNLSLVLRPSKRASSLDLLDLAAKEYGLKNQRELAKFLGVTPGRVSQIKGSAQITKSGISSVLKSAKKTSISTTKKTTCQELNNKILDTYKEFHGLATQQELADSLGATRALVAQWTSGNSQIPLPTVKKILKAAVPITIKPLLEMEKVDPGKPGGKWYFFSEKTNTKRATLIKKIAGKKGIYCYYDGLSRLSYVGKADRTPLDREVEGRLSQALPKTKLGYGQNMKKNIPVYQGNIVEYISAYEILPTELIPLAEALAIRISANTQFNKRLESLSK